MEAGSDMVLLMERRLRVIALTSARRKLFVGKMDFYVVIFVSLLIQGWSEGDLVVSLRIGEALFHGCSDVVAAGKSQTAALRGDYLQS